MVQSVLAPMAQADCDANLMREAVLRVPQMMSRYFVWWLEKTDGEEGMPVWYKWFYDMLHNLHRYRHWNNDHDVRSEFSEIAAALDPKHEPLRRTRFVGREEMKLCIQDIRKFLPESETFTLPYGTGNKDILESDVLRKLNSETPKCRFVALCLRSPQDDTVVTYPEEWDFEWGQYEAGCEKDYFAGKPPRFFDRNASASPICLCAFDVYLGTQQNLKGV
ncbi:hypothetical protein TWF481_003138 [Arthrobotrys musiformis]|uniref:Uncharacterized protein n=1 Tax=Arthrobotrys musiformis TaxID=47236 RepID=A0AAV9VPD4_9PEZI